MTQQERTEHILKLETEQAESKLQRDLTTDQRRSRQESINAQINLITTQLSIMSMTALLGVRL